jgi:hypothetical protein
MEQCPICFTELEVRDCAPCDDCGWNVPTEIEHLRDNRHTYTTYEIFQGLRLTLCNFCAVDFGSYQAEYFGFKNGERLNVAHFNFIAQVQQPGIVKDKFCPTCSRRHKFLKFVADVRLLNSAS